MRILRRSKLHRELSLFCALAVFLLAGCVSKAAESSDSRLDIQVVADAESHVNIPVEDLGGNFDNGICYSGIKNVTIRLDGKELTLENAIRDGQITPEEMFAYARLDARNGQCKESYHSKNGLAYFLYQYPEYEIRFAYDVYETPDGQQHLISSMNLYAPDTAGNGSDISYLPEGSNAAEAIDREDWGLSFVVDDVSANSCTVKCTQAGGQQLGRLETFAYMIFVEDGDILLHVRDSKQELTMDGETELVLDWENTKTSLVPGKYVLRLYITDNYDPALVTPMIRKFHDRQSYFIPFTIS